MRMKIYLLFLILLPTIISSLKGEKLKEIAVSEKNNIIEIGENNLVVQISWTKTEDFDFNYLLGVFEASNDPSFMNGIPIGIIKKNGKFNEVNVIDVMATEPYKYIRYIPPNSNNTKIFPIKIYGYELEENEKFEQQNYFQITNLPLVSIHTENFTDPLQTEDYNCTITIINNGKIENNENSFIKVRGRSSNFASPKKSFRIKFATKQKILDIKGKEKKWTLIANHFDRSFLRNFLAFKISDLIGLKFSPRCRPVDVLINGNYRGTYYICDKLEVGKNRLNITKMEETDITEPNISGGYLLEIDASSRRGGGNNIFTTNKGINGKIEYPKEDEITSEQKTYIVQKLNKFEDEIYNGILDSIDLESYSKYFLVEEFCADPDHVFSSFYFHKERNDDKFYFGPVWDFDLAFDNDRRLKPTSEKPEFSLNYGDSSGTTRQFIKTLLANKNVIKYIKKTWENLCETVLNEDVLLDFIEENSAKIKESAELNILKWDNTVTENRMPWGGNGGNWGNWNNRTNGGNWGNRTNGGNGGNWGNRTNGGNGGSWGNRTNGGNGGNWGRGGNGMGMGLGQKGEEYETSVEVVKEYVKNRFESLSNLINKAYSSADEE